MAGSSMGLHEAAEKLTDELVDQHRALASLMEELEAVDWYAQRAAATEDVSLREILVHNMNEEKEHAAMALEWLRRRDGKLDTFLRRYLWSTGSIVAVEKSADAEEEGGAVGAGDLGLRGLRGDGR
ncbi:MAG TPA: ferritin [Myxococcota bacterium]|nr:ferritin [Myxococcota bacterium]